MDRSSSPRSCAARWRAGGAFALALCVLFAGCSKKESSSTSSAAGAAATGTVVTQASWAPDALEELLAPIALYPDALLGQILAASVNAQEVLDAGNWLLEHQDLQGDALDKAAKEAGFGPAMLSLVHFPQVVDMMCQELDWTKQVGAAFTSDQKAVLDAVQRLRAQAVDVGNLQSSPQMTVETKTENGQSYVELAPADPKVVYVPQYDPQVVYTTPPAAAPVATSSSDDDDDDESNIMAGLLLFGAGMAVGAAINNSYCYPSWGYGAVYMGPRPFYPPAYVYRPMYPAYRPAYGYHPPGGYRHSYNNVNINRNTNININNNYFNRFDNNSNLKDRGRDGSRSPIASNRDRGAQASTRPSAGTRDVARSGTRPGASTRDAARPSAGDRSGQDWKGKSSYAGAKGGSKAGSRAGSAAHVDRGYGGSTRQSGTAAASRPSASTSRASRPSSATSASRPSTSRPSTRDVSAPSTASRPSVSSGESRSSGAGSASSSSMSDRGGGLSGTSRGSSGSFERASSARGRSSASSSASSSVARSSGGARAGGRR